MNDALLEMLSATAERIAQARADGVPVRDAARGMRVERQNKRAEAEEAFGVREGSNR